MRDILDHERPAEINSRSELGNEKGRFAMHAVDGRRLVAGGLDRTVASH